MEVVAVELVVLDPLLVMVETETLLTLLVHMLFLPEVAVAAKDFQ
jgi:hypothetical protein